jgi:hypothetical protein
MTNCKTDDYRPQLGQTRVVMRSRPQSSKQIVYDSRRSKQGSHDLSELKIFPTTCGILLRYEANKAFNWGQSRILQSNVICVRTFDVFGIFRTSDVTNEANQVARIVNKVSSGSSMLARNWQQTVLRVDFLTSTMMPPRNPMLADLERLFDTQPCRRACRFAR